MGNRVVCWWSGGITSAVACKIAIDIYGSDSCRVIMIDTKNEDKDTYRFKQDCEKWYGCPIEIITALGGDSGYETIQDVWRRYKSLNVATGAICSAELKRAVRYDFQDNNEYDYQVFGFEFDKKEFNRARSLKANHPKSKPIFPLLMYGLDKDACIKLVNDAGIEVPVTYQYGFRNNNCFNTGCVQGGVGYWQKMKRDFPDKFEKMADMEWELTEMKGKPVTMLKDQSKSAKDSGNVLVFLRKHPLYPELKSIDEMPECKVEPLFECNGFCGTNDFAEKRSSTEAEINFDMDEG
jgi:3'-phosphoadenosine 5'-phosphosulfate sulfotransferase (PAPS reductase)/FAD synthetase